MPKPTIREAVKKVLSSYYNQHWGYIVFEEHMDALRTACAEADAKMPETVDEWEGILEEWIRGAVAPSQNLTSWRYLAQRLTQYLAERGVGPADEEIDQLRVQLPDRVTGYGWSPAYQDVFDLRLKYDKPAAQRPTQKQTDDALDAENEGQGGDAK
jgi:hypothetical protein